MRHEISKKSKYYIPKEKKLEMIHFCYQYNDWKKELNGISYLQSPSTSEKVTSTKDDDPVFNIAVRRISILEKIQLVDNTASEVNPYLSNYILKCVVDGQSYEKMKASSNIPCCKDTFYKQVRKFYWLLAQRR